MEQKVEYINIKDLVLWTENPRDPIDARAKDQDIVDRAIEDKSLKWSLSKLAKEMGDYYDFSELPTVVYHGKKPLVYDGNRRIILGKIKHGCVTIPKGTALQIPDFPLEIPCNVCTKKIALNNVYRKHSDTGSWQPLERDIFLHKFMGEEKSPFLVLEEDTRIISNNPHLNQRFVKEEIFKEDILNSIGFFIKRGRLNSIHDDDDARAILSDISEKIKAKTISTRENRGKVVEVLEPTSQQIIDRNKDNKLHLSKIRFDETTERQKASRLSRRIVKKGVELFGGKLYLKIGEVSNLYRDITDLYIFYTSRKDELSSSFPGLIRMSLRLLCETAANSCKKRLEDYLKDNFEEAKKEINQDIKTLLSNQNVKKESIVQLLHTGAHNYQSTSNIEQTIAISIIIGSILTLTHGKEG
ncbi:hypothetical protein [Chitinophaga japonensis]|uniref:ParB/Sulfiredoxin domain-containing protein n=1 Tax=Chitinophaga japonensis TaxID=104662 RepID=A0A562T821_CHIJA|nr:hypothetical protein [Chitinophaga japonensis]TWI89284.1 hypothetical protein LX66_3379 [Chitinophaga japonensis]